MFSAVALTFCWNVGALDKNNNALAGHDLILVMSEGLITEQMMRYFSMRKKG